MWEIGFGVELRCANSLGVQSDGMGELPLILTNSRPRRVTLPTDHCAAQDTLRKTRHRVNDNSNPCTTLLFTYISPGWPGSPVFCARIPTSSGLCMPRLLAVGSKKSMLLLHQIAPSTRKSCHPCSTSRSLIIPTWQGDHMLTPSSIPDNGSTEASNTVSCSHASILDAGTSSCHRVRNH